MYSVTRSFGLRGLSGFAVEVEADVSGGLPAFSIVGLPDSAVRESADRVRAAIHRGENEITLIQQLGPAWQTLRHAGRDKALAGITSWEEVMRVTEQQTTESV